MDAKVYNWKRFWCPRDGRINLGDSGYMIDPENAMGRALNPDVKDYSSIAMIPCLALLGEPGIGKSQAIQEIIEDAENRHAAYIFENLRQFGSEDRFVRRVFESARYRDWVDGDFVLELMLDSLDECLLRIGTVVPILIEQLRQAPVSRLRLRIACRTAEWPLTLEKALSDNWGKDGFAAYELSPLRRQDVVLAAVSEGIDPDHFYEEIHRVRGEPLAIKPVTLRFLLKTYHRNHRLPETEAELYQQGCRLLCEESQDRRDSRVPFRLDPEQRFVIAMRIAAITVFSNKFAIWTGPNEGDIPDEDVAVDTMAVESELASTRLFPITRDAIEETLNSGLFSSRGRNRMGWAHQTYAEFLAAAYLFIKNLSSGKILSLITDELLGDLKVIPQLHETAARIAATNGQIFEILIGIDAKVLLRSDVSTADDTQRCKLLEALLRQSERSEFHAGMLKDHDRLRYLQHPMLAEQLRPFLTNPECNINAKFLALEIVRECSTEGLTRELVAIAFNRSANIDLRVHAISAIEVAADRLTKTNLIELARDNLEDISKRVSGAALEVLWPHYISAEQLFELIVPRERRGEINRYSMFVAHGITQHLHLEHLPAALSWVINLKLSRYSMDHIFEPLLDGILAKGWEHMYEPGVLLLFAQAVCNRIALDHGHLVDPKNVKNNAFLNDEIKRRRLLSEVVILIKALDRSPLFISLFRSGLARPEDFRWLLEKMESTEFPELISAWTRLCKFCYDLQNTVQTELILERSSKYPQVREAFSWLFTTINLDSPEARASREEYEKSIRRQERHAVRSQLDPPPADRIENWLLRCESGESGVWWQLIQQLTLKPESRHYDNATESDITTFPGWEAASQATRRRIIETAKQFILCNNDLRNEWATRPRIFFIPANACYQALRLLLVFDSGFVSGLGSAVWNNWAAALLTYPLSLDEDEAKRFHQPLMSMAYQASPESVIDTLVEKVRLQAAESQFIFCIERVGHLLDSRISGCLRQIIDERSLGPICTGQLISFLVEHGDQEAVDQAMAFIHVLQPFGVDELDLALAAADALSSVATPDLWVPIWQEIQNNPSFGRSLAERWSAPHRKRLILSHLTDQQLADLYIYLSREYRFNEGPPRADFHEIGTSEQIVTWKDNYLINLLKNRGTFSACSALVTVRDALQEAPWLNYALQDALTLARSRNWQPILPNSLLRLVNDPDARIINNGKNLLDVIIDSLRRIEIQLHGENPSIRDIWDYNRREKTWQPIDENALSDYVVRFLRNDIRGRGIVINREVEIRPGHAGPGERTDIQVDAVVRTDNGVQDVITCIIEAKCCWHRELMTAMRTQLVERYLHESRCRWGLYLVSWFLCEAWDASDRRKIETPKLGIDEVRDLITNQATAISRGDLTIKSFVLNTMLN